MCKAISEPDEVELLKNITLITKLVIKEQTLEESEKNNIYSQLM